MDASQPSSVCVNHAEVPGAAVCARCREAFCDGCLAYVINGRPWCELCGNNERESGRGNRGLAVAVLLGLLGAWALLMFVQLVVIRRVWLVSLAFVLVPFGAAWRVAWPPTAGDRPEIVDRRVTRAPLPRA